MWVGRFLECFYNWISQRLLTFSLWWILSTVCTTPPSKQSMCVTVWFDVLSLSPHISWFHHCAFTHTHTLSLIFATTPKWTPLSHCGTHPRLPFHDLCVDNVADNKSALSNLSSSLFSHLTPSLLTCFPSQCLLPARIKLPLCRYPLLCGRHRRCLPLLP